MLPIPKAHDYSHLPYYPAPWKELPVVPGFSVCGYANLPRSTAEAARWAATYAKLGARVYRAHKIDVPLKDNPTSHIPRFQWLLDALKKKGIPVLLEVIADRPASEFQGALANLARLDLSNVVGISPINEPQTEYDFDTLYALIRAIGYKGLIFGSNSVIQGAKGGVCHPGELSDAHVYCGLEGQQPGEYFEIEYKAQTWNHPVSQIDIATEIGHPPPATTRGRSEDQIIDVLFDRGCRCFVMFALLDRPELWSTSTDTNNLRLEAACQDPLRMETWRRLVQRCVGPSINLTANVKGELVEGGKWRVAGAA